VTHKPASVIARQPGFPAPVGREGQSRLWDRREVMALERKWRKETGLAPVDWKPGYRRAPPTWRAKVWRPEKPWR
jgi:hypothetical protein